MKTLDNLQDYPCGVRSNRVGHILNDLSFNRIIKNAATPSQATASLLSTLPEDYLKFLQSAHTANGFYINLFQQEQFPATDKDDKPLYWSNGSQMFATGATTGGTEGEALKSIKISVYHLNDAFIHELGHALEDFIATRTTGGDAFIKEKFDALPAEEKERVFSHYKKDHYEWFAQIFSAYFCSSQTRAHLGQNFVKSSEAAAELFGKDNRAEAYNLPSTSTFSSEVSTQVAQPASSSSKQQPCYCGISPDGWCVAYTQSGRILASGRPMYDSMQRPYCSQNCQYAQTNLMARWQKICAGSALTMSSQ